MQTFQSWSGGKDSTASIILEHIHGLPRSTIIFSEVMFDKKRGISGELPEHIEWVHNTAIPLFESWGHEVKILRADKDYLDLFFHKPVNSPKPERRDKFHGFLIAGRCAANRDLKIKPITEFYKSVKGDFTQYVGIAADEPERLKRLEGTNRISLLARYGYTEKMAFDLCREYGLLSPIYGYAKRGGCWFCPSATLGELAHTKQCFHHLWAELEELSKTDNLISTAFSYSRDFEEIDARVDEYIRRKQEEGLQLTLEEYENETGDK